MRRLAAIFAADVVGFSRLMAADETDTHGRLRVLIRDLIKPAIAERSGRVVKLMGDGLLAEFQSVIDAVDCALGIQELLPMREARLPEDRRFRLRIGINLGDIIIDGDDIYGDGVNVAARLEALAPAGGIAISSVVRESAAGSGALFADGGTHRVKNIDRPLRIWVWGGDDASALPSRPPEQSRSKIAVALSDFRSLSPSDAGLEAASGLSQDLAVELGRYSVFDVLPVGDGPDPGQSGADYLLSGSVRHTGARIRVSARLTEAAVGTQVWSQRYDGESGDVWLDEVTQKISGHLFQPLMRHAARRALAVSAGDPGRGAAVYDHYLTAFHHTEHPTRAGLVEAGNACRKVLEADPGFALAYEHLAWINIHTANNAWTDDPDEALRAARRDAVRGIALDDREPLLRSALGLVLAMTGNTDRGVREGRLAVELNPNDAELATFLGAILTYGGRTEAAFEAFDRADALSPGYPPIGLFRGIALFSARRYEEAAEGLEQFLTVLPEYGYGHALLVACRTGSGQRSAADDALRTLAGLNGTMTRTYLSRLLDGVEGSFVPALLSALERAGLPEG